MGFTDDRKNNWERLEDLLALIEGNSLRLLSRAEVREFGELYRRAATDLAIARSETRDPKLINYLNSLVIRAHGKIYRAETQGFGIIWQFFTRDFPVTFRKNIRYMLIAFSLFAVFAVFGFIATWRDIGFTDFVYLSGIEYQIKENNQWWLGLNDANQVGSSQIMTNNIGVTFRVFAMGALFGVGAAYDLALEGARFGSVFAACYSLNPPFGDALAAFVVGHGVIELSTIFFCAGAGMMIGYALINPGDLTRAQALKKKGMEATRIVIGSACLLVIAGTIEGFLSPSALPPVVKWLTGISTGVAMYSYLLLVGRSSMNKADVSNGDIAFEKQEIV
ncbi:MAG: stage II sporulation protein M [Acidobacteria bacterium]|nr:stage II sporulation protein M [Acidobacteriota bacterium]